LVWTAREALWQTPSAMKALEPAARVSRPEFDVHVTENAMVPMRDGDGRSRGAESNA